MYILMNNNIFIIICSIYLHFIYYYVYFLKYKIKYKKYNNIYEYKLCNTLYYFYYNSRI